MTQDANEFLMSGGTKSAKFDKIGTVVKGVIARKPELQQQRHIETGAGLTWDDGKPKMQIKVILKTAAKDDEDDNGERAIYLKSNMLKAVQAAVKTAGAAGLEIGGKLIVKFVKEGEKKNKAFSAPKLYQAKYEVPDPLEVAAASEAAQAAEAKEAPADEDDNDLTF